MQNEKKPTKMRHKKIKIEWNSTDFSITITVASARFKDSFVQDQLPFPPSSKKKPINPFFKIKNNKEGTKKIGTYEKY